MSYIGNVPTTAAFPFDQFSGTGSQTAFTLTYAPAGTTSILVSVSGVMQNPNTYSTIGTTLTFTGAPPSGTNNIAVLYLGLPVIGVTLPGNTAYQTPQDFTATAGQTTFTTAGAYTVGFVEVYRNGARLGNADFTATTGTTVVLANACVAGDLVTIVYFTLTSIVNALPQSGGTITGSLVVNGTTTMNGAIGSGYTGFKNRIINGDMRIDQRNAGAAVTLTASALYIADRWYAVRGASGTATARQSTTAPAGFINSFLYSVGTGAAPASGDYSTIAQRIEGLNVSDLGWGTASAQSVTLSFQVNSSLTGTFGVVLTNSAQTLAYATTYTITTANVWQSQSITITGPTSAAWLTTNGIGIQLHFDMGVGTTQSVAASTSWQSGNYLGVVGVVKPVSTSGATFYVTGVQLERGSNATSFEFIDYGRQLAQCQRYYQIWSTGWGGVSASAGYQYTGSVGFKADMRTSPTFGISSQTNSGRYPSANYFVGTANQYGGYVGYTATSSGGNDLWSVIGTASAEL